MTIQNLKQGQVIKNYKELCKILDIPVKAGDSKKAQLKELARYCKFTREGFKYIIEEIYNKPLTKVDGRGKAAGSRNNYKGIYAELADKLILDYLNSFNKSVINTTNNVIAEKIGLINHNFRTALYNQEKFYNVVKDKFSINTNKYCMIDTLKFIKTKNREIIKASLDRLKKKEYLEYTITYFIFDYYNKSRPASAEELKVIEKAEIFAMEEMKIEKKKTIDNSSKLTKIFNAKVFKQVKKQCKYIRGIYKGYSIKFNTDINIEENLYSQQQKQELNRLVIQALKRKIVKIKENVDSEYELYFETRNPFLPPWIYDRLSKKYIKHCKNFIRILCKLGVEDITQSILLCNNNEFKIGLSEKELDIKKDKIFKIMLEAEDY